MFTPEEISGDDLDQDEGDRRGLFLGRSVRRQAVVTVPALLQRRRSRQVKQRTQARSQASAVRRILERAPQPRRLAYGFLPRRVAKEETYQW